jgi:hypothetical protein
MNIYNYIFQCPAHDLKNIKYLTAALYISGAYCKLTEKKLSYPDK